MSRVLPRQRWLDPIDTFVQEHGRSIPRWAVVCAYECDPALLERAVVPALTRRGRGFRTLVLADAGALQKQLSDDRPLCARFNLHPVRLAHGGRGIFHPKLVFLRAGRAARVCFGSANISNGGFGGNLELWTHTDDIDVVSAVARFLTNLAASASVLIDPACKRGLGRALAGIEKAASERVWTSLDESFAERMRRLPDLEKTALDVVSPAYATTQGLRAARQAFPCASVTLHTDDNVQVPATNTTTLVYSPVIEGDEDARGAGQADPPRLHAKLFVFRGPHQTRAWLGSANFTAQALTKTASNGGNVEILFETSLPKGQADCLRDELSNLFEASTDPATPRTEDELDAPPACGSILACELGCKDGESLLTVHTTAGASTVTLGSRDVAVAIPIHGSKGVLRGADVPRLLPGCDDTGPGVWVIYECVGKARFPVVVNAPHVPEHDLSRPNLAPLDALLDELRGVLPKRRSLREESDAADGEEPDDTNDADADFEHEEKRLADAHHQGALDQIAVKAAVAKRLIVQLASVSERAELMKRLESDCKAGCAPHLHTVVAGWFSR